MANKNIVLCSDGTGNRDIKARGTNVFKLYEAVDIQGHKNNPSCRPQVAFYDDGIGSSSFLPLKIIGGAFGVGFSKNIRDLYTELVHVYQPGDSLYLFGFSRGAYTIRALAAMIQYCGILDVAQVPNGELKRRVKACWDQFAEVVFKPFQRDAGRGRCGSGSGASPGIGCHHASRVSTIRRATHRVCRSVGHRCSRWGAV